MPFYYGVTKFEYNILTLTDFMYEVKSVLKKGVRKSNLDDSYQTPILSEVGELIGFKNNVHQFLEDVMEKRIDETSYNFWGNINKLGGYNNLHSHLNSTDLDDILNMFSAVYYIKVPQNSGDICFSNPLFINFLNHYTPQEKDLIVFPSYVPHLVRPNKTNEDRISIAFNFKLQ